MLASCSSDSFSVEGQIDGVPEASVTLVYIGDHGPVAQRVPLDKGNTLRYEGYSEDYTLLAIWDAQGRLIAQMVARNGDDMTLKSDGFQVPTIEVSGNDVTKQWMKFRKDNQKALASQDTHAIDRLIEQQIKAHPDQLLSTVLLVAEYSQLSDQPKVSQLLKTIKPEARPQRLVSTLEYLLQHESKMPTLLTELNLYRHGSGVKDLVTKGKPALLLFWTRQDEGRKTFVDTLRQIARDYGDKLLVTDVMVNADSTQWTHTLHDDGTSWDHWWAPGGIMDPMLHGLVVDRTPLVLLTDSTAHIVHSGNSPADLRKHLGKLIK